MIVAVLSWRTPNDAGGSSRGVVFSLSGVGGGVMMRAFSPPLPRSIGCPAMHLGHGRSALYDRDRNAVPGPTPADRATCVPGRVLM